MNAISRIKKHIKLASNARARCMKLIVKSDPRYVVREGRTDSRSRSLFLDKLEKARKRITKARKAGHLSQIKTAEIAYSDLLTVAYQKIKDALGALEGVEYWEGQLLGLNIALDTIDNVKRFEEWQNRQAQQRSKS